MIMQEDIRRTASFSRKGLARPMRIVSLLPSLTEICFTLGLGNQLVGVSHACDFPSRAREISRITRSTLPTDLTDSGEISRHVETALSEGNALYELDREQLASLEPDLILTQDL